MIWILANLIIPGASTFFVVNVPFLWSNLAVVIRITAGNPYGKFELINKEEKR